MEDKLVKKMIYMTIILFIFVIVSFVFAKKITYDLKKEQELADHQLEEQESKYTKYTINYESNESDYKNYNSMSNSGELHYIDKNKANYTKTESTINSSKSISENDKIINNSVEPKSVEIIKLKDIYIQNGYSIVKDFEINSTKFAIISKMSEYQGEYSKTTKKKYYIYKYIEQKLYEAAYIMELSIPNDKVGHEADIFTINQNGNNIEINIDILPNTSRLYYKQKLLSFPHTAVNVLEIEFQKNK